jgi:Transposase domain (DUF772)/Transposase DDE domain
MVSARVSRRVWRAVPRSAFPGGRGGSSFLTVSGLGSGLAGAGREHGDLGFPGDGCLGGGGVREFRACFLGASGVALPAGDAEGVQGGAGGGGARGGDWSPARLALITVLQMAENLDDRGAAEAVADRLSWQYALGLGLDDEGFDHTVLSEFRSRVVAHGLEEHVLDALLERLASEHLVAAGGKQRTDSTHDCETASGAQEAAPRCGHRGERPNLITNAATTAATVPDNQMTGPIHEVLQARGLTPGRHYLDSGYPSASLVVSSLHKFGIVLVTPLLADTSSQARAGKGYDRSAFTIDYDTETATCPQGQLSASWSPATQRGTTAIVVTFDTTACGPCPVRELCTTSKRNRRQLTIWPREVH